MRVASQEPDRVALIDGDFQVSYGVLLQRALRLASVIKSRSGTSLRPVAIVGDKSHRAVEAILAALVTGRAYSFLNPSERLPRLRRMASLLRPSLVIDIGSNESDHAPAAIARGAPLISMPLELPTEPVEAVHAPASAAYVLFTSGSTGHPRGVVVGHSSAVAAQRAFIEYVGLCADDVVASKVALNFDVSTFDLFATLAVGGAVDLIDGQVLGTPSDFLSRIEQKRLTSLFTVPTVARMLLETCSDAHSQLSRLRRLMLTGEMISTRLARLMAPLIRNGCHVFNLYGMTESPWALSHELDADDLQQPNVLDIALDGSPVTADLSESGEIILRGVGLSGGYLTEQTEFGPDCGPMEQFATGDFAHQISGGHIRFLGRRDRQARRDGYRIELAEIENWMETNPHVELCYVICGQSGTTLVAYIALRTGSEYALGKEELFSFAHRVLPPYMVPDRIELLETAPRTSSGKKRYSSLAGVAHPP